MPASEVGYLRFKEGPIVSERPIDGFYAGYFTGRAGNGLALLTFNGGKVVGVDAAGIQYDGEYEWHGDTDDLNLHVRVTAPPGVSLVQGGDTGEQGFNYEVETSLKGSALDGTVTRIETPRGPINMRLQKLRGQH